MSRGRRRAWAVGAVATALVATAGGLAFLPAGAAETPSSAVTKKVTGGPFDGLAVTVAKTNNLVNEVVEVNWSGGRPTEPLANTFFRNFLQLMQCWGDDPAGPKPEQCQYGASIALDQMPGGGALASRQLRSAALPVDPAEKHPGTYLPFAAADGTEVGGIFEELSSMFDAQSSNEVAGGATRTDGKGQEFFEVHTAAEAPGLGCGRLVGAGKTPRSCWLVVVPRSDVEVDGSIRQGTGGRPESRLQSSPLSASNWANRIVFPLGFQPIGGACTQGGTLLPVLGHESTTEAITRWQQSLCAATGAAFDLSQLNDGAARAALAGPEPGLTVLSSPPASPPSRGAAVYAPIAVSGLGFAYVIETRTFPDDPPEVLQRTAQRITDLRLTPRLVAKLLSQSYQGGVPKLPDAMKANPYRMEDDPEFRQLNPFMEKINKQASNSVWTVITPLTPSDATRMVWRWIAADEKARQFLSGAPDEHKMVVNPEWKAANLGADNFAPLRVLDSFPKLDQACKDEVRDTHGTVTEGVLCPADAFPYANDMHEAVLSATRGDTLAKNSWDGFANPPVYKKGPAQRKGTRGIMVVSDTATAARYNVPMAALQNANGKFVKPDPANLLANVRALKPSATPGVLALDPNVKVDAAYPLTMVSYAATVPAALTAAERKAYAGFINYAVGDGQKTGVAPGSLPAGYAPMPKALITTAKTAAAAISNYKAPAPKPTPKPSGGGTGVGGGGGGGGSSGSGGVDTGSNSGSNSGSNGGGPPAVPPIDEPVSPTPLPDSALPPADPGLVSTPTPVDTPVQSTGLTQAVKVGTTARYSLLGVLALALLAVFAGRVLPRLALAGGAAGAARAAGATRSFPGASNSALRTPVPGRESDGAWDAPAGGARGGDAGAQP